MAMTFVKGEKTRAIADFMAEHPEATSRDAFNALGKKYGMTVGAISTTMSALRTGRMQIKSTKPANAALARVSSELKTKIDLPNAERKFGLEELIRGRNLISKIGNVQDVIEVINAISACGGVEEALEVTKAVHAFEQSMAK